MADESRFLTYLFCDLVGSTALTRTQQDPEEFFELMQRFKSFCSEAIEQHQGFAARFMGDGVLAYFGYPVALESSAEAAVRCALALTEQVPALDSRLQLHSGIASGWGILGHSRLSGGGEEISVVSNAINLAARLEGEAKAGQVLVTAEIQQELQGLFDFAAAVSAQLKGFDAPQNLYPVLGRGGFQSASHRHSETGRDVVVGRDEEIARLHNLWHAAKTGKRGTAVLVRGEGGIGKTTLLRHFKQSLENQQKARIAVFYANRFEQNSGFYPVRSYLERELAQQPSTAADPLAAWLAQFHGGKELGRQTELIGTLLRREQDPSRPANVLQEQMLAALVALFLAMASRQPVLMLVEDLHWLDASSMELGRRLRGAADGAPVFILAASRPTADAAAAWDWDETLALALMDEPASYALLDTIDSRQQLDDGTRARITGKAGGVPLLLREFTRATLSAQQAEAPVNRAAQVVPDTLLESYAARLEALTQDKDVLAAAAVAGEAVPPALLARALNLAQAEIEAKLDGMVTAGLMQCYRQAQDAHYDFAHALLRDAAYRGLLGKRRRVLHAAILAANLEMDKDFLATQPAQAAHHQAGSDDYAAAITTLLQASQQRFAAAQFAEGQGLLEQALEWIDRISPAAQRDALELQLQALLGLTITQQRGFGDDTARNAYARAWGLCRQIENSGDAEYAALWGIWAHRVVIAQMSGSQEMVDGLERIDRRRPSPTSTVLTHTAAGFNKFVTGDLDGYDRHLQQVLTHYDTAAHGQLGLMYSMDPKTLCLLNSAHVHAIQGRPQAADAARIAAFAHMDSLDLEFLQPYTRIWGWASNLYHGAPEPLLDDVNAAIALAQKLGNTFWVCAGQLRLAQVMRWHHELDAAIEYFETGLATAQAIGLRFTIGYLRCEYAAALAAAGRFEQAQPIFEEELRLTAESGVVCHQAEQHRLYGEALGRSGKANLGLAKIQFDLGLTLARAQNAVAWERKILANLQEFDLPEQPAKRGRA